MIWINYLIRVPLGVVVATIFIGFAVIATTFMAVCVNWQDEAGGFAALPEEWLDLVKTIGGLTET